jgi:ribosomal protein L11 methyltransferase
MEQNRWLRVRAQSPSPEHTEALVEGLIASGATAVEQQGDAVITYHADVTNPDEMARSLAAAATEFTGVDIAVEWSWLDDEDWTREWRRGLGARRVGDHFIVTPTWIEPDASENDVVITIDPQMAFGTGEHATTRGMLRLMENIIRDGDVVLDVGAGSAILAIAAAKLGATEVDAVEFDPDAIENATENIERNETVAEVKLVCEMVDIAYLAQRPSHYDVIVANVLSGVLRPLLHAFREALKPEGHLLLSGILRDEADDMIEASRAAGFLIKAEDREEEWWSGLLHPDRQ